MCLLGVRGNSVPQEMFGRQLFPCFGRGDRMVYSRNGQKNHSYMYDFLAIMYCQYNCAAYSPYLVHPW